MQMNESQELEEDNWEEWCDTCETNIFGLEEERAGLGDFLDDPREHIPTEELSSNTYNYIGHLMCKYKTDTGRNVVGHGTGFLIHRIKDTKQWIILSVHHNFFQRDD